MSESNETAVAVEKLAILAVQKILKRVQSFLSDEILHSWSFLQIELNQIQGSLATILAILQDAAEDSTLTGQTRPFSYWLQKLKHIAYEADDVLDDFVYQNLKPKVPNLNFLKSAFNFKLARKVKKLNDSLHELINQGRGFDFDFQIRFRDRKIIQIDLDRVTESDYGIEDTVVGREADVLKIVRLLSSSREKQILTVVPIVGIHGLGKTTLAKLVYEQAMARKLFDVNIWLCSPLPLEIDFLSIFRKMLKSLNKDAECLNDKYEIFLQLENELAGKTFLLVLDDFRIGDPHSWNDLHRIFNRICLKRGNAILMTSINEEVLSKLSPHCYRLGFLSDEECWFIMKERAFRNASAQIQRSLESIGRDIAKCCGGVPLVAKVLRGTLGFHLDFAAWFVIRERIAPLKNRIYDDNLLSVLDLCFDQLPSDLKLSLVFCSHFPEGFPIRKEELIQVWMAEGLVDSRDQGNKYFSALFENSFFHDVERKDDGDVILFKLPDILPSFTIPAIRISIIPQAIDTHSEYLIFSSYRHSAFLSFPDDSTKIFQWSRKLRTVNFHGDHIEELPSSVGKLRHLRYLSVSNTKIRVLPNSISKLYHLQSLDISNTRIEALPESISKLQNLQTLNLSDSYMVDLPESITKLHRLQNLNVSNTNIKELPESISKLQKLQTLNISNSRIKELPESISKLQKLQTLNISNSRIKELPETMAALQDLKTLNVSNSNIVEFPEIITKLENLETLDVSYCDIKEFPQSITDLRKLQTLKFLRCRSLSKFPKRDMNNLINLKNISFSYEHQIPFGLGLLTSLQTLPIFVVGPDFGGSIGELESLNELRGHLEITRLEEVQDKEEAKRANLQAKTRIQGSVLQWSNGANDRISKDEELLECLRPNPNIRRVKIKCYMGKRWPSWMFITKYPTDFFYSLPAINNLLELELEHCWNSVKLPQLGYLPYLKFLRISHMRRVKCIDNDFYGIDIAGSSSKRLRVFPSLKSLSVSWMENLTEWYSPSNSSSFAVFPCLENLSIQLCPKLASFPFADLSAVVKLEIKDCENLRFIIHEQQLFSHLNSMSVVGCPKLNLIRSWLQSQPCFREFRVRKCQWLIFVPEDLGTLSSLTSLEITCCKRLRCFSEEILCGLAQLKHLSIGAFSEELDDFRYLNRINELSCLEELEIWGSDILGREMSNLPGQIRGLTGLKSLKITGFTVMEELPEWLVNLQSLELLSLNHCRNLGCQSATAIIQLPRLADLYIRNCPVLEESDSEWLQSLKTKNIKVEFLNVGVSNH